MLVGAALELESIQAERPRADRAGKLPPSLQVNWSLQIVGAGVVIPESKTPRLYLRLKTAAHELTDPKLINLAVQHVVVCELDSTHAEKLRDLVPSMRNPSENDKETFNLLVRGALKEIPRFVHLEHFRQIITIIEFLGAKPDAAAMSVFAAQAAQLAEKAKIQSA